MNIKALLVPLALAGSIFAQGMSTPQLFVQTKTRLWGSSNAFNLLRSQSANNPVGIPTQCPGWFWPVSTTLGDIDNDGQEDVLFCGEQRFLLAVRLKDPIGNLLQTPQVIWAYYDDQGWIGKHRYSTDQAVIRDFDGDGLNEVAAVIGPAPGTSSNRAVVFEAGVGPNDPVLNEPTPVIGASYALDTLVPAWTFSATSGAGSCGGPSGGVNFIATSSRVIGGTANDEVCIYDKSQGRIAVFVYGRPQGTLRAIYGRQSPGADAHNMAIIDIDQDGHDDLIGGSVVNIWNGTEFPLLSLPHVSIFCGGGNHVDASIPYDADGDGDSEIVVQHCGYDLLVDGPDANGNHALIWENSQQNNGSQAIYHGQTAVVAHLLNGNDAFGFNGDHYVSTPKGQLNTNGAVVVNGNGNELCISLNLFGSTWIPNGPQLGLLSRINFDGGLTDEILSLNPKTTTTGLEQNYTVWRLKHTNLDPNLPYEWQVVHEHKQQQPAPSITPERAEVRDFFGNANEDIVLLGRNGYQVVYTGL